MVIPSRRYLKNPAWSRVLVKYLRASPFFFFVTQSFLQRNKSTAFKIQEFTSKCSGWRSGKMRCLGFKPFFISFVQLYHIIFTVLKVFPFFLTSTYFFLFKREGIRFVQLFLSWLKKISHEWEGEVRRLSGTMRVWTLSLRAGQRSWGRRNIKESKRVGPFRQGVIHHMFS